MSQERMSKRMRLRAAALEYARAHQPNQETDHNIEKLLEAGEKLEQAAVDYVRIKDRLDGTYGPG